MASVDLSGRGHVTNLHLICIQSYPWFYTTYVRFLRFFWKSKKNHDFFRFFELLRTFSRTLLCAAVSLSSLLVQLIRRDIIIASFVRPTGNDDRTTTTSCHHHHQQVRRGHVTKGYHRLGQDDTSQPLSDSDPASRSGSASDELDLDSDISKHHVTCLFITLSVVGYSRTHIDRMKLNSGLDVFYMQFDQKTVCSTRDQHGEIYYPVFPLIVTTFAMNIHLTMCEVVMSMYSFICTVIKAT